MFYGRCCLSCKLYEMDPDNDKSWDLHKYEGIARAYCQYFKNKSSSKEFCSHYEACSDSLSAARARALEKWL